MSGFIGRNIQKNAYLLKREIRKQTRTSVNEMQPGDILRVGGKLEIVTSEGKYYSEVTTLLHLGSFIPKSSNESNLVLNSVDSLNITQQLCSGIFPNLRKIIFASTMDVYKRTNSTIDESSELEVNNLYVASKLMSEHVVENYCGRNNIAFDILRIGHVYGNGDDVYQKVFPNMVRAIKSGNVFRWNGNTKQSLNLIYVDDLISILAQLIDSERGMGVLNIVSSTNVRVEELIEILEEETNLKLNIEVVDDMKEKFQYNYSNEKLRENLIFAETPIELAIRQILHSSV